MLGQRVGLPLDIDDVCTHDVVNHGLDGSFFSVPSHPRGWVLVRNHRSTHPMRPADSPDHKWDRKTALHGPRRPVWRQPLQHRAAECIPTAVLRQLHQLHPPVPCELQLCHNGVSGRARDIEYSRRLSRPPQVGDSDGMSSGGTSVPTSVQSSGDSSCLPSRKVPDAFYFVILPATTINQCTPAVIAWAGQQE